MTTLFNQFNETTEFYLGFVFLLFLVCLFILRFSALNVLNLLLVIKVYLSYWILSFNFFSIFLFSISATAAVELYNCLVDIRLNVLCWFLVLVLVLVSSCVILNSIDYLSIMESYLFLVYIILFQFSMNVFTLSHDLIIIFLNWDLIGLISYLLINFWSSKTFCGIKAVVYNKCGDCFFLLVLAFSFINNLAFDLWMVFFSFSFIFFSEWVSLSFLFISFSKSAQFPFSSWLLNAMSAPTPISALLHSSTMVIAGVYLGLIVYSLLIMFIWYFDLFFIMILLLPVYSLLWSLIEAFYLSDIKSIIACSTINQISYMFLALLIFPLVSVFHILIHALFKSLLFLLAGSLIHIQSNFQSLYKMKLNNSLIRILFIAGVVILIFSFSKEDIIHALNSMYSSTLIYILGFLCGMLTTIYSLKIYIYCFYLSYYGILYSSFILPILIINSILIDQSLDSCFSFSSLSLFNFGFGSLFSFSTSDSILHFSILILFMVLLFYQMNTSYLLISLFFIFSRELSYFNFQLLFIIFSTFFFKAPIHAIELFTGSSSYYCLYLIHYLTSFQYGCYATGLLFLFSI